MNEYYITSIDDDDPDYEVSDNFVLSTVPRVGEYINIGCGYYVVRSIIHSTEEWTKIAAHIHVKFVCTSDADATVAIIERGTIV